MDIDFLQIKRDLLDYYRICHNGDEREFYRGLCWMENSVSRILEERSTTRLTHEQLIQFLADQLDDSQRQFDKLQQQLAVRDKEIKRLRRINAELSNLSKKDRRQMKRDDVISSLVAEKAKLTKERDRLLSQLCQYPPSE